MTDLTTDFNNLLKGCEAPLTRPYRFDYNDIDSFLREAYQIHSQISQLHFNLRNCRKAYLNTTPLRKSRLLSLPSFTQPAMTDTDRENIDTNAKQMLRGLDSKIKGLSIAHKATREAQLAIINKKYGSKFSVLGSWATGGVAVAKKPEQITDEEKLAQTSQHKESVIWLLTMELESCCKTQQEMMTIRLNRELEKTNNLLATAQKMDIPLPGDRIVKSKHPPEKSSAAKTGSGYAPELPQEQVQMMEQGNQDMFNYYENATAKVQNTQKSLMEIAELHNMLTSHLDTQASHIEQLVNDSFNATDNVGGGNKELKKATKKPSLARGIFFAASGLCAFLIAWDLAF